MRHSLKSGPENLRPETLTPRTLRLATDQNTDCINFICEANFDNKKLGA